jgi:hypothetical protein
MAGSAINKSTISKAFKDARNKTDITVDNPPSFHEIKSFAGTPVQRTRN